MTVVDYRSGVDERRDAGSRVAWLGWAVYLGMSWTWCIGMFLPVLLVRNYGIWGWVVFAVPNVLGAAAMGWVLREQRDSRQIADAHRPMLAAFSFVTVSFQIFFAFWIFWRIRIDPGHFVKATMALALMVLLVSRVHPASARVVAAAVFLVSCVCIVQTTRHGMNWPVDAWYREWRRGYQAGGVGLLAPVCAFGFLFCPYLDRTFHAARQPLTARDARLAFTVGFCVFFLAMIVFTLAYAPAMLWKFNSVPYYDPLYWWLQVHLLVQLAFTIGIHCANPLGEGAARSMSRAIAFMLAALACGYAAFIATLDLQPRKYESGELVYRLFMAFYGLVFPAYVWLAVIPSPHAKPPMRSLAVFAAATVLAVPFYWLGFIDQKMIWLLPGLLIVLLARLAVGRRCASLPCPPSRRGE